MKIEFIIPTYSRHHHLKALICSLLAQTNPNWVAHIIADHSPLDINEKNIKFLHLINDDRIKFTRLKERHNDWGHTPRNYGIEHAKEDWVIMTGEDNYYVPIFVDEFLKEASNPENKFIYCDMVHNLNSDAYMPVKTKMELGYIDLGCYMVKRDLIGDIRLDITKPESDFKFMCDYIKQNEVKVITKISKILYVHN